MFDVALASIFATTTYRSPKSGHTSAEFQPLPDAIFAQPLEAQPA